MRAECLAGWLAVTCSSCVRAGTTVGVTRDGQPVASVEAGFEWRLEDHDGPKPGWFCAKGNEPNGIRVSTLVHYELEAPSRALSIGFALGTELRSPIGLLSFEGEALATPARQGVGLGIHVGRAGRIRFKNQNRGCRHGYFQYSVGPFLGAVENAVAAYLVAGVGVRLSLDSGDSLYLAGKDE